MPKKKAGNAGKKIDSYQHDDKDRVNNPPVGLVTPETDKDTDRKTYSYDPHLDPQLIWAGKAEHTSFDVPTVSLHVHERIDPRTIIESVRKKSGPQQRQRSLFELFEENSPMREAIEFYKYRHNWSNRLIAGDSLQFPAHFRSSVQCATKRMEMTTPYGRLNPSLTFGST